MREKEVRGLMEAYSQVYTPQELTEEQVWEEVETWVNSLIEEGYDLSDYTWEEMYESYLEEIYQTMPSMPGTSPKLKDLSIGPGGFNIKNKPVNTGISPIFQRPGTGIWGPAAPTAAAPAASRPAAPAASRPAAGASARPTATAAAPKPAAAPAAKPAGSAMDQWAKANPKLAAAKAERDRTRGTSATTNPLMKDMKSKLPEPKPAPTLAGTVAAASKPTAFDPSSNASTSSAAKPAPTLAGTVAAASKPTAFDPSSNASTSSAAKPTTPVNKATGSKKPGSIVSGVDLFDIVKGYLIDEGYAESEDAAMVIMVNMSEGWKESILESYGVELELDESQYARENPEKYERSSEAREGRRRRSGINDPNTGINSPAFQAFMAQQMGGKKKKKD
jgi:hypothetical protein